MSLVFYFLTFNLIRIIDYKSFLHIFFLWHTSQHKRQIDRETSRLSTYTKRSAADDVLRLKFVFTLRDPPPDPPSPIIFDSPFGKFPQAHLAIVIVITLNPRYDAQVL